MVITGRLDRVFKSRIVASRESGPSSLRFAVSETISREEIGLLAATRDIARAVVALAIERF